MFTVGSKRSQVMVYLSIMTSELRANKSGENLVLIIVTLGEFNAEHEIPKMHPLNSFPNLFLCSKKQINHTESTQLPLHKNVA